MEEFLEILKTISEFFVSLGAVFSDFSSAVSSVDSLAETITVLAETLSEALSTVMLLVETLATILATTWWIILLIVSVLALILPVVVTVVVEGGKYLLTAVPVYTLAKKTKTPYAVLAWIPLFQDLFCMFLLQKISGRPDFELWGKVRVRKGMIMFWSYVAVYFLGPTIITTFIAVCNTVPMIGQIVGAFSTLLYLLPLVFCAFIEYAYLRDVINRFKPNEKTNQVHAAVVTILDTVLLVFPFGLIKSIYLLFMMWKKPLYAADRLPFVEQQEQPQEQPA